MTCLSFAAMLYIGKWHDYLYYDVYWRSEIRVSSLCLGALAALAVSRGVGRHATYGGIPSARLGLMLLVVAVILQFEGVHNAVKYSVGSIVVAVALLFIAQHGRSYIWRSRILTWLGTLSFSIYIWQQPFHKFVEVKGWSPLTGLVLALAFGTGSFYLIERPARRWLNAKFAPRPIGERPMDVVVLVGSNVSGPSVATSPILPGTIATVPQAT